MTGSLRRSTRSTLLYVGVGCRCWHRSPLSWEKESHVWLDWCEARSLRHEWIRGGRGYTAVGTVAPMMSWEETHKIDTDTHTRTHTTWQQEHTWPAGRTSQLVRQECWASLNPFIHTEHTPILTRTQYDTCRHMSCGGKWQFLPEKMQMATPQATWKVLLLSSSRRVFLLETCVSVCVVTQTTVLFTRL